VLSWRYYPHEPTSHGPIDAKLYARPAVTIMFQQLALASFFPNSILGDCGSQRSPVRCVLDLLAVG